MEPIKKKGEDCMLKRVTTEQDLAYYNFIWMTAWREKGYDFEFSPVVLERWLVTTPEGQPVGTAEFKPFHPGISSFESVAEVERMPELVQDRRLVAEIDKYAVLPEHRGKYVDDLVAAAVLVARKHGIRWFVTLLEPVFCRAIKILYHPPMIQLGPKTFYKGDDVIPIVIDVKDVAAHPERYNITLPAVLAAVGDAC
jgi:hypothetical protein